MKILTNKKINEFRKFINEHNSDCYCQLAYNYDKEDFVFYADFTKGMYSDNSERIIEVSKKENDYKKYTLNYLIELLDNSDAICFGDYSLNNIKFNIAD